MIEPLLQEIVRLTAETATLRAAHDKAVAELAHLKKLYDALSHQYSLLRRKIIGPLKERVPVDEAQQSLFLVLEALGRLEGGDPEAKANAEAVLRDLAEASKKEKAKRTPHGRKNLTLTELPVERVVLEPAERLVEGGELLEKIGEEVSEILERRAATLVRVQIVRPKYKVPGAVVEEQTAEASGPVVVEAPAPLVDTRIVIAPPFEGPLPRCMAGPGLLAHVLVSKYCDHIPLHRQESIFRREGVTLARSTMCDWVGGCAGLLERIVKEMWEDARRTAPWILTDGTGILVQAKEQCRRVSFYVVVAGREHVLFGAVNKNDGDSVAGLLAGFGGRPMISDASSVYHELQRQEREAGRAIDEAGCWSHARRKLFDALPTDRKRALVIIGFIGLLYDVHREATQPRTGVTDGAKRKAHAGPLIEELYRYVEAEWPALVEGTPIAAAFGYLVNQKAPLLRFLDDGRLRLDNNPSELQLRHEVVGRKNWLFCGSDQGVKWNTTLVSLIASCKLHDLEPWAYLRDVLTLLPRWSQREVLELAPKYWRTTLARPEVQQKLEALRLLDKQRPAR